MWRLVSPKATLKRTQEDVPKRVDLPPDALLPRSVADLDEVFAQLSLDDSGEVPANLDREASVG